MTVVYRFDDKKACGERGRDDMKKHLVMLMSAVLAVSLAACGGSGAGGGAAAQQESAAQQTNAGADAEGGNGNTEGGTKEAADGEDAGSQVVDPGAAYVEGGTQLADHDRYALTVTGYHVDGDCLDVGLEILNKAQKDYSVYIGQVIVNHGIVKYEIEGGTKNEYEGLRVGSGEKAESSIRIPASEFEKYGISAADELRFSIYGYPEEDEEEDVDEEEDEEIVFEEVIEEPDETEGSGDGMTDDLQVAEEESESYSEEFCVYPTGKEAAEIVPAQVTAKDEYEWFNDSEMYAFGTGKSLSEQTDDSKGVVSYCIENRSDRELGFALEDITVNGMPMFDTDTYLSDPEDEEPEKMIFRLEERCYLPAGTILLSEMITHKNLEENGSGKVSDLAFMLKVKDEDDQEIESREMSCRFQDDASSTAGTAESASETGTASGSEDSYVREAVKAKEGDLYDLTVTGYDQNDLIFIVHCEIKNKAEKAYRYEFYTFNWEINRHYIEDDHGDYFMMDLNREVEIEPGKTAACDLMIPATTLEKLGIDRVDELQFVVYGRSVEDYKAQSAAYEKGDYFYEEKDEKIYDTVTVYPTGMTDDEISEAISVTEKDCAAYVSGDGFTMGVLKEVNMGNSYGALTVYFENRTNEELYLTWEEITVNGNPLEHYSELSGHMDSEQVTLRLQPNAKGFQSVLSRDELKENGIDGDIKDLACSVYHKEHPAQGSQFASYSEKITCSFSD